MSVTRLAYGRKRVPPFRGARQPEWSIGLGWDGLRRRFLGCRPGSRQSTGEDEGPLRRVALAERLVQQVELWHEVFRRAPADQDGDATRGEPAVVPGHFLSRIGVQSIGHLILRCEAQLHDGVQRRAAPTPRIFQRP